MLKAFPECKNVVITCNWNIFGNKIIGKLSGPQYWGKQLLLRSTCQVKKADSGLAQGFIVRTSSIAQSCLILYI